MSDLIPVTASTFEEKVLQSKIPVLVDFWAPWCAPCKVVGPILESIREEFVDKLEVVAVNVNENENEALSAKYNIRNIPALLLFKDGVVVDQIVGAKPRSGIITFVEKNLQ